MPSSEPPSTTRPPAGVSSSGPTDAPGESPPPPPPPSTTSQAPSTVEAFLQNDPARTGFDPQTQWWVNYFRVLTGGMTAEGRHHYRESRYRANEARDCARCEKHRDYLLRYSPIVRFLAEKVADLNGALDASNILCRRCPAPVRADGTAVVARRAAGFDPAYGILLCANEMRDRKHLEDSLAHEMVHAWDHLRWKAEFAGEKGLRHAACTEIRAAMLSGECRWGREAITRGNWTLTQQFQRCVRLHAVQSVMMRPRCKDDVHATKVVNEVWDSCFADTRPFDEVYK